MRNNRALRSVAFGVVLTGLALAGLGFATQVPEAMMQSTDSQLPDNDGRLHAAWGLALPYAKRILVVGRGLPQGLIRWWQKLGIQVDVQHGAGDLSHGSFPDDLAVPASQDANEVRVAYTYDLVLMWDRAAEELQADREVIPHVAHRNRDGGEAGAR